VNVVGGGGGHDRNNSAYTRRNKGRRPCRVDKRICNARSRWCTATPVRKDCLCTRRRPHSRATDLLCNRANRNISEDRSAYIARWRRTGIDRTGLNRVVGYFNDNGNARHCHRQNRLYFCIGYRRERRCNTAPDTRKRRVECNFRWPNNPNLLYISSGCANTRGTDLPCSRPGTDTGACPVCWRIRHRNHTSVFFPRTRPRLKRVVRR